MLKIIIINKFFDIVFMNYTEIVHFTPSHHKITNIFYIVECYFSEFSKPPLQMSYRPFYSLATWGQCPVKPMLLVIQLTIVSERCYESVFRGYAESPNKCFSGVVRLPASALWNNSVFLSTLPSWEHPGHPVWALVISKLSSTTTCKNKFYPQKRAFSK